MTGSTLCVDHDDGSEVSSPSLSTVEGLDENKAAEEARTTCSIIMQSSSSDALCNHLHPSFQDHGDISESHLTIRSLSIHGNAISSSMRTEGGDDGLDDICSAGDLGHSSTCFFPEHHTLRGSIPVKVVRCALKRLNKTKVIPCERARNMTLLGHHQLQLGDLLGEGSFSSVYSVRQFNDIADSEDCLEMPDASQLVVKVLRKKLLRNPPMLAACAADLVKEGLLLSRLSHENVLMVHAWSHRGVQAFSSGRHDATFLVLGRLETTLSSKLAGWRARKTDLSLNFFTSIFLASKVKLQAKWKSFQDRMDVVDGLMAAVVYLHSQQILHRDLKPDNVGFDARGVLKVFDFDVARLLPSTLKFNSTICYQMTKRVGSPRYMSPECARGDPYNAKSDVYTVALLVHELFTLEKPYDDIPSELHDDMVFYSATRPPLQAKWPFLLKSTLQRAWNERISIRPTMSEFQACWVSELKTVLLDEKRKRYHRCFSGKHAPPSRNDPSAVRVNNTSTNSLSKKAMRRNHDIWDSARTSPDSCHEYSESFSD